MSENPAAIISTIRDMLAETHRANRHINVAKRELETWTEDLEYSQREYEKAIESLKVLFKTIIDVGGGGRFYFDEKRFLEVMKLSEDEISMAVRSEYET